MIYNIYLIIRKQLDQINKIYDINIIVLFYLIKKKNCDKIMMIDKYEFNYKFIVRDLIFFIEIVLFFYLDV